MKKLIKQLGIISIIVCMLSLNVMAEDIKITVNIYGNEVEFNKTTGIPFVDGKYRTQVPLRVTMETFGAVVEWNSKDKIANIKKDGTTVEIPIGEKYIYINGEKIETDTVAMVENGKTYLPIRPVAEAFGAIVIWDENTKTIYIKDDLNGIDKKYNVSMLNQESNYYNFGKFVYDKENQYFVVDSKKIARRNIKTGNVNNIYYTENQISELSINGNNLYFIESESKSSKYMETLKKMDLSTYVDSDVYEQNNTGMRLETYIIYDNKIIVESSHIVYDNQKTKFYYEIGIVESKNKVKVLSYEEGFVDKLYAYNDKLYYDNVGDIMELDLKNYSKKKILARVNDFTMYKDMIYFSDYDCDIYKAPLNEVGSKELLYRLDRTKFTNKQTEIQCLNIRNNKLYFIITPDWTLYNLSSNGELQRSLYMKDCPPQIAIYGDLAFYNAYLLGDLVGGKSIKVKDNLTISDWLQSKKTNENSNDDSSKSQVNTKYIFNLSDEMIKEAIAEGKKGFNNVSQIMKDKYYLKPYVSSDYDFLVARVHLLTPYLSIMQNVVLLGEYATDSEIQKRVEEIKNAFSVTQVISLSLVYNCTSFENPEFLDIVIEQDGKIFKPYFEFSSSLPEITDNWPDFPAYQNLLTIDYYNIGVDKIDVSKPAKLIITHVKGSDIKSTFLIDFSNIK